MKKLVILGLLSLLAACSGSNSDSSLEQKTNLFSFAMEERNLCGQTSPYIDYEVVAYSDEGDIISRHKPNQQGAISALFEQDQVNLMIIRDRGQGFPGLDITVLIDYPIGDLDTFSVSTVNTEGCDCQIVDINAINPNIWSDDLLDTNLPYKNSTLTGFSESHICKLPNGEDPLLIVSTTENTDRNPQPYDHILLEDPSNHINDGVISTYYMPQTDFDHDISIADGEASNISITYFSDNLYPLFLSLRNRLNFKLIKHPRVAADRVVASYYDHSALDESTDELLGWAVFIPVNESTSVIDYTKPELDQSILKDIFNGQLTTYDFNSENLVITRKTLGIERENGSVDHWSINYLNSIHETPQFTLPDDYLSEEEGYFETTRAKGISIVEVSDIMTADEFFESGWYGTLFHNYHTNDIYPHSEYSSLKRPTKQFSEISLSQFPTIM